MLAEILLTPIAQPHAQRLWNFLPLLLRKGFLHFNGLRALAPTRCVVVRIPQRARSANEVGQASQRSGKRWDNKVGHNKVGQASQRSVASEISRGIRQKTEAHLFRG